MVKESRTATHIIKQSGISAPEADLANLVEAAKKDATAVADEVGPTYSLATVWSHMLILLM
ncbi:MAG: hypothetical protein ACKPKO_25505 [Candidatus Fonsibacter sp.]